MPESGCKNSHKCQIKVQFQFVGSKPSKVACIGVLLACVCEPSLYTVKAILILDNDGDRLFAKYYDDTYPSVKEQKAFEKNIFNKTHRTDSEIALLEGLTVVYKSSIDLYFYVIGSSYENELMLMAVLNCLFDSLSQMLRKNVEKRALLENMEGLFLAVDEIVDGGVILESDPQQVVHRVALRGEDVPLTEQTVSQVLQSAKEQIKWSLLRSPYVQQRGGLLPSAQVGVEWQGLCIFASQQRLSFLLPCPLPLEEEQLIGGGQICRGTVT
ncbi:coatomer subunit zeta-1-like protein [Cricetulus griseus]|uniref:Coatomer subunit zeta n=1 Tax=Cricetulus griseus TaxID=10029 RepID=A0A061IFE7_CRIGR|nr:coatomer subunit zeta-1-like protein [Cricetulus griseus]